MKFQVKILIITLVILVMTLLLNSVLSLSSFEKVYVNSLVSVYEIAGKNLKRKIELAIRFGKPLDKFEGMQQLLTEVKDKNPELSEVAIGSPEGQILYHSYDNKMIGKNFTYKVPQFKDVDKSHTNLIDNIVYVTFIPLLDRNKAIVGLINISFPRSVVLNKIKEMANENLKILWVLMLFTSTGLIIFMAVFVVHPIKSEIINISSMLIWPGNLTSRIFLNPLEQVEEQVNEDISYGITQIGSKYKYLDLDKIKKETDRLGFYIQEFVKSSLSKIQDIQNLKKYQTEIFETCLDLDKIKAQLENMQKEQNTKIEFTKAGKTISVVREIEHILEIFQIIQHILTCQSKVRKKDEV